MKLLKKTIEHLTLYKGNIMARLRKGAQNLQGTLLAPGVRVEFINEDSCYPPLKRINVKHPYPVVRYLETGNHKSSEKDKQGNEDT